MCIFCEAPSKKNHRACLEAFGLDYNPKSEADAKAWLEARRKEFARLLRVSS